VVVGGGVADAGDLLLDPLRVELRRRACVAPEIPVVRAELGPVAGAVGAALWGAEISLAA
jgi:glucokinase